MPKAVTEGSSLFRKLFRIRSRWFFRNLLPVQSFTWSDYAVEPNNLYTYRVVPVFGKPGELTYGDELVLEKVKPEPLKDRKHKVLSTGVRQPARLMLLDSTTLSPTINH